MNIRIEVCKDTYVTSCTPAPPVDLPECEDGWEIGNGTAVCATEAPIAKSDLAVTGGDPSMAIGGIALAIALACTGAVLVLANERKKNALRAGQKDKA